ncbi:3-dehydroquinate synthase [Patescibacteria group bacterium]
MGKIQVSLKKRIDQSYEISLNTAYLKRLIVDLKKNKWGNKYALICDAKVRKLYGNDLAEKLNKAGIKVEVFSFQNGEKFKNLKTVERLLGAMSKSEFFRDDAVIALGGGVTGDIAGFVASIYMRGIPYIQIPTTLLAMVDSSVGGKTGVDTSYGKNLIGTFTQPEKVYINVNFLKTLPKKQMLNGVGEAIKYGVIADKKVLGLLRRNKEKIMNLNVRTLERLISMCIKIKARIVEIDEKESEVRKILNYGHTFGHAIEKISRYKIEHGEAITIGMCLINTIAVNKKWLKPKKAEKIKATIKMYGLPTKYEKLKPANKLIAATKLDKKVKDGKILYIVPYKIGRVLLTDKITNRDIIKACKKHS